MFQPGELVVYGSTGVCRVEGFGGLDQPGEDRGKRYYLLKPLWQDGMIYAPVDSEKVPMRPVMSREEAEALIGRMPEIPAASCRGMTMMPSGSARMMSPGLTLMPPQEMGTLISPGPSL